MAIANGLAPTARVVGAFAAAVSVTADPSAARRGRSREVSGAREHACVRVRVRPRVRLLAPPDAAAAAASLLGPRARVTDDLPASFAALSQATAPSQRRRCAKAAGRGGRVVARSGRNGRCMRAPAVGGARADCGSFGVMRRPRAARRVDAVAAAKPPRLVGRHVRASLGSIRHHIDLTY